MEIKITVEDVAQYKPFASRKELRMWITKNEDIIKEAMQETGFDVIADLIKTKIYIKE